MLKESHSSLKEIYQKLSEEAEGLQKEIKMNLFHISEIDGFLNSIYEQEDIDFKVFSPRSVENIYKTQISSQKEKKYKLENDNRLLYSRLNKVNYYMNGLKDAIEEKPISKNLCALEIQEKERQRIAMELHDTTLQNLAHMGHKIELASLYMEKDVLQAKLELATVSKNLKIVIEEIRNTIFDLRPMSFDDLGLKESFENLFTKLKESNTSFDFEVKVDNIICDNNLILMTIFRVVQEACSNTIKHSEGNIIKIIIEQKGNNCKIMIRDNGMGFVVDEITEKNDNRHFGIAVMKERVKLLGGDILFHSVAGEGTEINMNIPLK